MALGSTIAKNASVGPRATQTRGLERFNKIVREIDESWFKVVTSPRS
jgi:hypothetical protein